MKSSSDLVKIVIVATLFGLLVTIPTSQLAAASRRSSDNEASDNNNDNNEASDNNNDNSDSSDGGSSSSSNRQGLIDQLCDLAEKHPTAAEAIARLLGYPGVGAAASALCSLRSSG